MKRHSYGRIALWGAVVSALTASLLFASAHSRADASQDAVIDTAAPIQPSQCAPCHLDIGRVDVKGLIFSHGNHLLVSCEGCHFRMPHRNDETERVPMENCFACHGVRHSTQGELATGECADCHTDPEGLRPTSHGLSWAKEPHAEVAAESGVNRCMMCHEPIRDCDVCHAEEALGIPEMPLAYHPMVTPLDKGPSVTIQPKGPVSISQCSYCHASIDDASGERIVFAHDDHIARHYRCEACHPRFAHTALGIERPEMIECYRCHGLKHNSHGLVATEECEDCHPSSFELVPGNHTKSFIEGQHKKPAEADPAYCAMCHPASFCAACHQGESVSPNVPNEAVVPTGHTDARWQGQHGKDYLEGESQCGTCHAPDSCKECHRTVVPHPVGFAQNHKLEAGASREDCNLCHTDRSVCQECHHADVKSQELVRENCVGCHDEMRTVPATDIQNKGLVEHAVHFDVSKTAVGKPYKCFECHVNFGSSETARAIELQQGHDMRLCYGCHGALDPFGQLIAPYEGGTLCLRCHKDTNI